MKLCDIFDGKTREREIGEIAFKTCYDIVVAGLGVAGAIAAMTAARNGMSVFGIEKQNTMGGTGTVGGIWSYYMGNRGGLYCEIDHEATRLAQTDYPAGEENPHKPLHGQSGQYKSEALEKACDDCGVSYALSSAVVGVFCTGKKVVGLRYFDGETLHDIGSRFVIDCTGNGEVCMACGCEMNYGRETDSSYQPYSNIAQNRYRGGSETRYMCLLFEATINL